MNEEKEEIEIFPFIKGDRIDLVTQNSKWVNLYAKWMNDPEVRRYARQMFPRSLDQIKKWFEPTKDEGLRDFIVFNIYHKKDKRPIGSAGFSHINWLNMNANIWASIGESEYWGKGIVVEAAKLLINFGFTELNFHKIYAGVYSPNKRSLRATEKLGFKEEAVLKEEMYVDGKFVNSHRFALFKKDWLEQKKNYE